MRPTHHLRGPYRVEESYSLRHLSPDQFSVTVDARISVHRVEDYPYRPVYVGVMFAELHDFLHDAMIFQDSKDAEYHIQNFRLPEIMFDEWERIACILPTELGQDLFRAGQMQEIEKTLTELNIDPKDRVKAITAIRLSHNESV